MSLFLAIDRGSRCHTMTPQKLTSSRSVFLLGLRGRRGQQLIQPQAKTGSDGGHAMNYGERDQADNAKGHGRFQEKDNEGTDRDLRPGNYLWGSRGAKFYARRAFRTRSGSGELRVQVKVSKEVIPD
jgi:hypothetical protein